MDRRLVVSAFVTLAATPPLAGVIAILLAWCLHQWNTPVWLLGVAGFAIFCGGSYVVWRFARKLISGRMAFSIRVMLIAVAVIAVLLSTVGRWFFGAYRQHQAVRSVAARGGGVLDFIGLRASDPRSLLYLWIGYDPFERVQILEIESDQAFAAGVEQSKHFADVEILSFSGSFTAAGLQQASGLNRFPSLRVAEFMESSIDGEVLAELAKWTSHKEVFINGCPNISDASLRHLVGLPNLERLSLVEEGGGMVISDAGLTHIGQMKNLKRLMLIGLPVTDSGLVHLHGLSKLETLVIRQTAITWKGLTELYKALPDCCVITDVLVRGRAEVQQIDVCKQVTQSGRLDRYRIQSESERSGSCYEDSAKRERKSTIAGLTSRWQRRCG